MKKFLAFVFVGLIVCSGAWAATIGITVNVASKLEASVDAATWTIALDNTGTAIDNSAQGQLTVKSSKSSYNVSFSSTNSGYLVNGTNSILYMIKVDTTGWAAGVYSNELSGYTQLTEGKKIVFQSKTPTAGKTFNIGFNIAAYTDYYVDGAYTDTITITIATGA